MGGDAAPLVVPLFAPEAADAARFGPKAANLAALGHAGPPAHGGYAIDAAAYRLQLKALGLEAAARGVFAAQDSPHERRHALRWKLGLMIQPVAPGVAELLLAAWRALRYMATHEIEPADTAMALILQPLVPARIAGGGLSRTADGEMHVNAARGPGSALAQGEVVPYRYLLTAAGALKDAGVGRKYNAIACVHSAAASRRPLFAARCLVDDEILALGRMMMRPEEVLGVPVEIEWAADGAGIRLLQARPLSLQQPAVPDEIWPQHPRLAGHPAGVGWGTGRACVIQPSRAASSLVASDRSFRSDSASSSPTK